MMMLKKERCRVIKKPGAKARPGGYLSNSGQIKGKEKFPALSL
jgi:hypothetical protein